MVPTTPNPGASINPAPGPGATISAAIPAAPAKAPTPPKPGITPTLAGTGKDKVQGINGVYKTNLLPANMSLHHVLNAGKFSNTDMTEEMFNNVKDTIESFKPRFATVQTGDKKGEPDWDSFEDTNDKTKKLCLTFYNEAKLKSGKTLDDKQKAALNAEGGWVEARTDGQYIVIPKIHSTNIPVPFEADGKTINPIKMKEAQTRALWLVKLGAHMMTTVMDPSSKKNFGTQTKDFAKTFKQTVYLAPKIPFDLNNTFVDPYDRDGFLKRQFQKVFPKPPSILIHPIGTDKTRGNPFGNYEKIRVLADEIL